MRAIASLSFALLVAVVVSGCGAPRGTHVRFATASPSQIQALENHPEVVWYDFKAGDEVPLDFGVLGVSEGVTEQPITFVARRDFSILVFPNGTTAFSFDGKHAVPAERAAKWVIALGADEEGGRATIGLFIGERKDMPEELR